MILTEEEAGKKICPSSFTIRDRGPWNCLGSNCMAWRWKILYEYSEQQMMAAAYPPSQPKKKNTGKGYYGLSGSANSDNTNGA